MKKEKSTKVKPAKKKPAEGKNPGGRPSKYKPEYADQARKLCLLGYIDTELATFFEVDVATIGRWKNEFPKFCEALKAGKEIANANVAQRLYERAMGFQHDSVEIKVVSDGMGLGSSVVKVPVKKVYPPDTAAAIFFLKNRDKDRWRDKTETDITSKGQGLTGKLDLSKLDDKELALLDQLTSKCMPEQK